MAKHVTDPFPNVLQPSESPTAKILSVDSELLTFENRQERRIVSFHDFSPGVSREENWIIVLPGFGETKTDVLTVAYFLAKNGFHTLRFDYSDHVGESDGDILLTSLTKMKNDILSALDYVFARFQPTTIGAVGSSLACRPLLRAAAEDDRIDLIVNLVSVVDLRKTLFQIYRYDHFEDAHRGVSKGPTDILGFLVDHDHFLETSIRDRYENLTTTIDDVRNIKVPITFFAAERDVWVDLADVKRVFHETRSQEKDLVVLSGAMHRLDENPQVVKAALKGVVERVLKNLQGNRKHGKIAEPDLREIGRRLRKEKERNRLLHPITKNAEREFWRGFLDKYGFALKVTEYWNLLDFIYRLLGEPASGEKILDAGCGTGNYGTFLILKWTYRLRQNLSAPPSSCFYIGVDFVNEAMCQAKEIHEKFQVDFGWHNRAIPREQPIAFSYFLSDLEARLPFADNSFDKICCNMVISYLQNKQDALSELLRVLKPKGQVVITSLKPFADLSELYRDFVDTAKTPEDIRNALELFNNIIRVRTKETDGVYQFCSEEELMTLLVNAGAQGVETYRSFGNQVNVAVGTKK